MALPEEHHKGLPYDNKAPYPRRQCSGCLTNPCERGSSGYTRSRPPQVPQGAVPVRARLQPCRTRPPARATLAAEGVRPFQIGPKRQDLIVVGVTNALVAESALPNRKAENEFLPDSVGRASLDVLHHTFERRIRRGREEHMKTVEHKGVQPAAVLGPVSETASPRRSHTQVSEQAEAALPSCRLRHS